MKPNFKPGLKNINRMMMKKLTVRFLLVLGVMLLGHVVKGQTIMHWNGTTWVNGGLGSSYAPSDTTSHTIFQIDSLQNCTIHTSTVKGIILKDDDVGTICTIDGVVIADSVNINLRSSSSHPQPILLVDSVLNVNILRGGGKINGAGTMNFNAINFSKQSDKIVNILLGVKNLNILSGTISITNVFLISNLNISATASVTIGGRSDSEYPEISNLVQIDGILINNYFYSGSIRDYYLQTHNIILSTTGTLTNTLGKITILSSFSIGGIISTAKSIDNYNCNFDQSLTSFNLSIFGNANIKFSDLTSTSTVLPGIKYKYINNLSITGNGKFTADRSLTVHSLNLTSGGSLIASGSPAITITTPISTIDGKLLLTSGTTLTNTISSLSLTGTTSALSYLNRPSLVVNLNATYDSISNCNLQQVIVNSGKTGIINSPSASYKITQIDVADSLRVYSMLRNDILNIGASGKVKLKGYTLVNQKVDITAGGSLTSSGNLTMADGSNLFFPNTGQVIGAINWQRRYGGLGWQYFGVTASGTNKTNIKGRISSTLYLNKYDESLPTKRWVAMDNSNFVRGRGYELGITPTAPQILNDTIVFNGVPAVDTVIVTGLTYTTTNGSYQDSQRGYNLVANPYTAPIDVSTFFAENTMLSSIYYWDDSGAGKGTFVARSNDATPIYTPSTIPGSNSTRITKSYLAPNQGFFVKILQGRDSVIFRKDQIVHQLNDNYLKEAVISDIKPNYIRLEVENNSGTKNDCVIKFSDRGSDTINRQLDIFKLTSGTFPVEMYSLKGTEQFAIQTRKGVTNDISIPIGVMVKNNEQHVFSMNNFDALPADINIYFVDDTLKQTANLREASYTVTLPAKTINNRFRLVLKSGTVPTFSNTEIENVNNVNIYSITEKIYVDFAQEMKDVHIEITDLSGRIIHQQNISDAQGNVELDGNFTVNNVYIIKVTGKNFSKINKLVLQ